MPENAASQTTEHDGGKKPRKIGCITVMWVSALVGGFLVWYNGFREVPLRISPETTYITEPLTADGKRVDYFAFYKGEITPPNVATDDNGYRLIFRHLGDVAWGEKPSHDVLQKLYAELDLDPNVPPDMVYLDFYRYVDQLEKRHPEKLKETTELVKQHGGSVGPFEIAHFITDKTDSPHLFPVVKFWAEENGPALDLIAEAAAKPIYFVPLVSTSESPNLLDALFEFDTYQEARNFARSLQLRARYRASLGDYDGTVDDILACHRLGRHVGGRGLMIDMLVGIAIEGIAVAAPLDVGLPERASTEQLERLAEGIRNLPPRMTPERCFEFERYFALDQIQLAATKIENLSAILPMPDRLAMFADRLGYDWNLITRQLNERIDILVTETDTSSLPAGMVLIDYDYRPWFWLTLGSRSHEMADTFCMSFVSADSFYEACRRTECIDNMRLVTLAMLIYERRNGTLPPAFSVDADGTPLHSWRVHLLPYLGDESLAELYSQIRLDEPWDSEHNSRFHSRNLDVYRCPSAVKNDGEANYAVIVGDDLAFANDGKGRSLDGFERYMILLVERKEGVCWMKPDSEIPQHAAETDGINTAAASIGSNHIGGANFGLRDGSVQFYSQMLSPSRLTDLIRSTATKTD